MSETSLTESVAHDPLINVIERAPLPKEGGAGGTGESLDRAAAEAMDARLRREFDALRARLREQAMRNDPGQTQPADSRTQAADRASAPLGEVPVRVRKRYLRVGNQYFLKDAPYQMTFEDLGPYLVSQHSRPDVVESMVEMVKAKSWKRILVSGHEAFRREVWLQATLLGLQVSGYQPKAADLAHPSESRRELMSSRVAYAGEILPRANGTRRPTSGPQSERQLGRGAGRDSERESPADARAGSPAVSRTPHPGRFGDAVDAQRAMQMAVIVAAMRAQGFSDRSIGRVELHAGKLYDTFRAEGIRVPIPRVFDPKAPSMRLRAPRPAPGRPAEREIKRTPSGPEQPSL